MPVFPKRWTGTGRTIVYRSLQDPKEGTLVFGSPTCDTEDLDLEVGSGGA